MKLLRMTVKARCVGTATVWLLTVWLGGMPVRAAAAQPGSPMVEAPDWGASGTDAGELLLGELNCTACHRADAAVKARLGVRPAPLPGDVGARITPQYLRAFLNHPHA